MTNQEKIAKYDQIVMALWSMAMHGNMLQSMIAANLIRQLDIDGPDGEDPDEA